MFKAVLRSLVVTLGLGLSTISLATPITFSGTSGARAASATFDVLAGNLVVRLTNTSTSDVLVPTDVLTGVFFDIPTAGALGSVSAVLNPGSMVSYDADGQPLGGVVGGEWAYANALSGAPGGATEGISSSGLGLFGGPTFPGPDLQGPAAVNGLQYGLLSLGDNAATGNGGITGSGGLIKNSVVFTLSGIPGGFDPSSAGITRVSFQYGTALTEPNVPGNGCTTGCGDTFIPEPMPLALLGIGALALFLTRRRTVQPEVRMIV